MNLLAIQNYLSNSHEWRSNRAQECGTDVKTIKLVINALFAGARLGINQYYSLFRDLNYDTELMIALMNNSAIAELKSEIAVMWKSIILADQIPRRRNQNGRLKSVTSRDRWNLYFRLEQQVIQTVRRYLKLTENPCFTIHDGWYCRHELDVIELQDYISKCIGYQIKIELK
jgi:hypothetical protein